MNHFSYLGQSKNGAFKTAMKKRLFSMMGAIAMLSATVALPGPAQAQSDCHEAYEHVCVPSNLSGAWRIHVEKGFKTKALCISLGAWEGENPVVIEWNGRYAARTIKAKGYTTAVMVRVKQAKQPGTLRVYSPGSHSINYQWRSCNTTMGNNIENMGWTR